MKWNVRMRQLHRWLSVAFVVAFIINLIAQLIGSQAVWIGLLAVPPILLLMVTGLYLFALPYVARRRAVD